MIACDDPSLHVWTGCGAFVCHVCGPRRVRNTNIGISWAQVQTEWSRFVTLTLAPEDWQKRRQKMRDLSRSIKRDGREWECAWSTERGSQTGMIHIHAIQHGSFIPQELLQRKWGARVDIRAIKDTTGNVVRYVSKDAMKVSNYMTKGTADEYDACLALNGGRPMHWTRGFLHGKGIKEAIKLGKIDLGTNSQHEWRWASVEEYEEITGHIR